MVEFLGDSFFLATILGMNFLLLFMLHLTQWRKNLLSLAWTMFFVVATIILDLWALVLLFPEAREFVRAYVRMPSYLILMCTVWTLLYASLRKAIDGVKRRREKKVDITPPKK